MEDIDKLIDLAAGIVARDMAARPPKGSDGIWRFDLALRGFFGESHNHPREFWAGVAKRAYAKNAGKDTWDRAGYGSVDYLRVRDARVRRGAQQVAST